MTGVAVAFMGSPIYRAITGRVIAPWAMQGVAAEGDALEVGGGTGALAVELLHRSPDLRLVVTDFDDVMVERAARAVAPFGDRASARQADACALAFDDEQFDLVLAMAVIHHTPDWRVAITEAVRVLRPGGQLVGFDLFPPSPLHHGSGAHSADEFEQALRAEPVTDVRTRKAPGGVMLRFCATKRPV